MVVEQVDAASKIDPHIRNLSEGAIEAIEDLLTGLAEVRPMQFTRSAIRSIDHARTVLIDAVRVKTVDNQ